MIAIHGRHEASRRAGSDEVRGPQWAVQARTPPPRGVAVSSLHLIPAVIRGERPR